MTTRKKNYVVKEIVEKKLFDGIEKFRIRWKGYSSEDDTWETEDKFNGGYKLIQWYESNEFFNKFNDEPSIIGLKVYKKRIKLLIEWKKTDEKQYYYSSAIALCNTDFVISFYEKFISLNNENVNISCDASISIPKVKNKIFNIIGVARNEDQRMFLVALAGQDEAVFINDDIMKSVYPRQLITFYEQNLFSVE